MIIRSVDFLEGVAAIPSDVRADRIQQVCVAGVDVEHRHFVYDVVEADAVGPAHARRSVATVSPCAFRRLLNVQETAQLDSIVAVVTHATLPPPNTPPPHPHPPLPPL